MLNGLSRSFAPLYFKVREANQVMATEEPCDIAYEFGSGVFDFQEYPQGFPKPGYYLCWYFCKLWNIDGVLMCRETSMAV